MNEILNESLNLVFLVTGFTVGFGHCIGMCGPIAVSLSLGLKDRSATVPQLLYNLGRIMTYVLLGGVMGITGSFTMVASSILHFQKGILILTGVMVFLMGLAMGGWISLSRVFGNDDSTRGLFSRWFHRLSAHRSPALYLPLGLLLGLLPCGPVYTALLVSARAGMEARSSLEGFLTGAGIMFSFGLGTVPSLLLVGKLAGLGWLKRRELVYRIGSILMIVAGVFFTIKGVLY